MSAYYAPGSVLSNLQSFPILNVKIFPYSSYDFHSVGEIDSEWLRSEFWAGMVKAIGNENLLFESSISRCQSSEIMLVTKFLPWYLHLLLF